MRVRVVGWLAVANLLCGVVAAAPAPLKLDEKPGGDMELGFRPAENQPGETNPPGFVWRPQKEAASYDFECASDSGFKNLVAGESGLKYNVFCPTKALATEKPLYWRFRYTDKKGVKSPWSKTRSFTIAKSAVVFPMPPRQEIIGRIPKQHPRMFLRPEELPRYRDLAQGQLKTEYENLVKDCENILKSPPETADLPKYPQGMKAKSDEWMKIWWGNREQTIKVLDSAAKLGFTHRLGGKDEYAQLGRKMLMEAAEWDPKGATNFKYNDEAGMPYAYFFARAYSFLNDVLSDADKAKCREVMTFRGNEMYKYLSGRMFWNPFESHANRGWHKLCEAGIAFLGEIPEAEEWVCFAMNYFFVVYPVWCDTDGGWHEGVSYWDGYQRRFSYFADVMKSATGVDAYKKPYFSRAGFYAMYMQPPGTPGGGFGDLVPERRADANWPLMSTLAAQAQNPYWEWYVYEISKIARPTPKAPKGSKTPAPKPEPGPALESGYIGFVRGAAPKVSIKAPDELPTSRVFRGVGQAYLNVTLKDAKQNVEVGFKSSPFGTMSHGYDANNSFFLYAYGQRLLAPTGRRDAYGSDHHANWMWETKSTNSILVNGQGQTPKHSMTCKGQITAFATSDWLDYVAGDAGSAYGQNLKRFDRHIVFVKPDVVIVWDRLEAPAASTFDWLMHSPNEIKVLDSASALAASGDVQCRVSMLAPAGLELSVTDQYDVPPRARIKGPDGKPLKEWHFTAKSKPAEKTDFVTLMRIGKGDQSAEQPAKLSQTPRGAEIETQSAGAKLRMILPKAPGQPIEVTRGEKKAKLEPTIKP